MPFAYYFGGRGQGHAGRWELMHLLVSRLVDSKVGLGALVPDERQGVW